MLGQKPTTTTILLVAIADQRRNVLTQQIEALGYSVIGVADEASLHTAVKIHRYDLLVVDMVGEPADHSRALADRAAALLGSDTPLLTLTGKHNADAESWTRETLSRRVAGALRNHGGADVLAERHAHFEGLNILDPETTFFSRRYFEAIFPTELERARRMHQPLTLLLIDFGAEPLSSSAWHSIGMRLLNSLRQTDLLVRFESSVVLALLPATEGALGRAVASRLVASLDLLRATLVEIPHPSVGIAAYPPHGLTGDALLAAVRHALTYAVHAGQIISYDQT